MFCFDMKKLVEKLLLLLCVIVLLKSSAADYAIAITLTEFLDPGAKTINGYCCDSTYTYGCVKWFVACDFLFKFCVEPAQSGSLSPTTCTTGFKNTGETCRDTDRCSFEQKTYNEISNPWTLTFQHLWQGFYFKTRVEDFDTITGANELIVKDAWFFPNQIFAVNTEYPESKISYRPKSTNTTFNFSFIVKCIPPAVPPYCDEQTTTTSTTSIRSTTSTTSTWNPSSKSPSKGPSSTKRFTTSSSSTSSSPSTTSASSSTSSSLSTSPASLSRHSVSASTTGTTPPTTTTTPTTTSPPKRDCSDWLKAGVTKNSIQMIWPTGSPYLINVYCDMSDAGGGWTLIQQRVDNITDFDYGWESFKEGFGEDMSTFTSNFWLGNDQIHYITSQKTYTLRIDLWDCSDSQAYEEYAAFKIDDESNFYMVHVSNGSGRAGDSFNPPQAGFGNLQDGMKFSTVDKDHDNWAYSCAKYFHGGWWFNACGLANLNGQYKVDCFYSSPFQDGITWYTWKNGHFSPKKVTMKVRPTLTD